MSLLASLRGAGVLDAVDCHVATRLGRRAQCSDPHVLVALALAVRAPRHGHVCVDLESVDTQQLLPPDPENPAPPLPEDREHWALNVAESSLVGTDPAKLDRPFFLDRTRLYTHRYWHYQTQVAAKLQQLAARPLRAPEDPDSLKEALEVLFSPPGGSAEPTLNRQRLAGAVAALSDLTVITGGPGMGKTWTVRNIIALALLGRPEDAPALRIALAAPSGKAAVRMREALAEDLRTSLIPALSAVIGPERAQAIAGRILRLEAQTLHRLLGWQPSNPTRFKHNVKRPLLHDLVIVDECSMIDLAMMAKLLDAIGPKTRLVLLGDPNQLASVEAGTVLADICGFAGTAGPAVSAHMQLGLRSILQAQQADQIGLSPQAGLSDTIVRFNKNHRFSAGSPIGQCALACLEQPFSLARTLQLFQDGSELQRLDHNQSQLSPAGLARIKSALQPLLDIVAVGPGNQPDRVHHRRMLQVFAQHRVLCAHRKGPLGATQINQELSTLLRPRGTQQSRHWEGLPVIVRVNDSAVGRANGDVGLIVRLKGELMAAFPGPDELPEDGSTPPAHLNLVEYLSLARLPDHGPCYAMTIHKAQGSQWPDITVVLPARPSPILTRELLYTAITRARRTVAVLGPEDILAQALQTPIQRASGLGEALKDQASQ